MFAHTCHTPFFPQNKRVHSFVSDARQVPGGARGRLGGSIVRGRISPSGDCGWDDGCDRLRAAGQLAPGKSHGTTHSCLSMFSAHHTHALSLSNICTSPAIYSSDSDDEQVVADARVVNTSQPRLNGRVAAAATFDARSQRYLVEGLTENGIPLALKPENVILPPRCRVRVNRPPMTPSPEPITRTHR